jgi:hypothetical protein
MVTGQLNSEMPVVPIMLIANIVLLVNIGVNAVYFIKMRQIDSMVKFIKLDIALPITCVMLMGLGIWIVHEFGFGTV